MCKCIICDEETVCAAKTFKSFRFGTSGEEIFYIDYRICVNCQKTLCISAELERYVYDYMKIFMKAIVGLKKREVPIIYKTERRKKERRSTDQDPSS